LFAAYGVDATSVDLIAEHAGFSRGAFYSNFANKDELVVELIESYTAVHVTEAESIAESVPSGRKLLEALYERSLRRRQERPWESMLWVEFWLYAARNPTVLPTLRRRMDSRLGLVEGLVAKRLTRLGVDAGVEPRHVAAAVLAIDEGISLLSMTDPDTYPPDAFFQVLEFLEGVLAAAASPRAGTEVTAFEG